MQTYEKKTGQISTLSRVATNVTELQYEFWFQVLETINKSFGFVIALQMNNIVLKWLDKEEVNPYQFFVIFALIGISMIISRLREYWAFNMKEKQQQAANAIVQAVKEVEEVMDPVEMKSLISSHSFFNS